MLPSRCSLTFHVHACFRRYDVSFRGGETTFKEWPYYVYDELESSRDVAPTDLITTANMPYHHLLATLHASCRTKSGDGVGGEAGGGGGGGFFLGEEEARECLGEDYLQASSGVGRLPAVSGDEWGTQA